MRTRLWIIGLCLTAAAWLAGCAPGLDASEKQTAIIALQEGDYATAGVHADRYLRQNPDDVDALLLSSLCLARTASDMGGVNKAAYNLERATNLAPKRFDAWYLYGWLLYENGKYTEALTALDKAENVMPSSLDINSPARANLYMMIGVSCAHNNLPRGFSYLQALRRFEQFRTRPEVYNSLAILCLKQGDSAQALTWLLEGEKLAPENSDLLRNIAVIYDIYLNNPVLARRFYVRCLGSLPPEKAGVTGAQIRNRLQQLQ